MDLNAAKKHIRDNAVISQKPFKKGGQQCGIPNMPVIIESEELSVKIEIGYHRSALKNKELAKTIFELIIDELVY